MGAGLVGRELTSSKVCSEGNEDETATADMVLSSSKYLQHMEREGDAVRAARARLCVRDGADVSGRIRYTILLCRQ